MQYITANMDSLCKSYELPNYLADPCANITKWTPYITRSLTAVLYDATGAFLEYDPKTWITYKSAIFQSVMSFIAMQNASILQVILSNIWFMVIFGMYIKHTVRRENGFNFTATSLASWTLPFALLGSYYSSGRLLESVLPTVSACFFIVASVFPDIKNSFFVRPRVTADIYMTKLAKSIIECYIKKEYFQHTNALQNYIRKVNHKFERIYIRSDIHDAPEQDGLLIVDFGVRHAGFMCNVFLQSCRRDTQMLIHNAEESINSLYGARWLCNIVILLALSIVVTIIYDGVHLFTVVPTILLVLCFVKLLMRINSASWICIWIWSETIGPSNGGNSFSHFFHSIVYIPGSFVMWLLLMAKQSYNATVPVEDIVRNVCVGIDQVSRFISMEEDTHNQDSKRATLQKDVSRALASIIIGAKSMNVNVNVNKIPRGVYMIDDENTKNVCIDGPTYTGNIPAVDILQWDQYLEWDQIFTLQWDNPNYWIIQAKDNKTAENNIWSAYGHLMVTLISCSRNAEKASEAINIIDNETLDQSKEFIGISWNLKTKMFIVHSALHELWKVEISHKVGTGHVAGATRCNALFVPLGTVIQVPLWSNIEYIDIGSRETIMTIYDIKKLVDVTVSTIYHVLKATYKAIETILRDRSYIAAMQSSTSKNTKNMWSSLEHYCLIVSDNNIRNKMLTSLSNASDFHAMLAAHSVTVP